MVVDAATGCGTRLSLRRASRADSIYLAPDSTTTFPLVVGAALGYVIGTNDPIRVAEETAIIDHLTNGKYFVGFARGYQARWTNILGQFSGAQATSSDGGDVDRMNREIFEERVEMVLDCWTNETNRLDG